MVLELFISEIRNGSREKRRSCEKNQSHIGAIYVPFCLILSIYGHSEIHLEMIQSQMIHSCLLQGIKQVLLDLF